jgi:hypothetical protein
MGGTLLSLNGCGGTGTSPPPPPPPPGKIYHVVVIFQENRTPDNLFQDPVLISKGADIAQSGKDSKGNTIPLTKVSLTADYNPGHFHDFLALPVRRIARLLTWTRPRCNPNFQMAEQTLSPTACSRPIRGPAFRLISSLFPGHRLRRAGALCLRRKIRTQTVRQTPDVTRLQAPRLP